MKRAAAYTLLLACTLLCACKDTTFRSSVPSYPVHLRLNIKGEYPDFVTANTCRYLSFPKQRYPIDAIGYAGILIYIGMDAQYHAYDLACPRCLNREQGVEPDGIFAVCPLCGEAYDLSYGLAVPTKGKSKEALRQYNAQYDGTYLTITDK